MTDTVDLTDIGCCKDADDEDVQFHVGDAALSVHVASSGLRSVCAFTGIKRSWVEGDSFFVEGGWSPGPAVRVMRCGAHHAAVLQVRVQEAVEARVAKVQQQIQQQPPPDAGARHSARSGGARRGRKAGQLVLVVDPDTKHRAALTAMLKAGGQSPLFVADAVQALDIYEADPEAVAVVLSELNPTDDMSCWQLCRDIRHREREGGRPRTPVFALTSIHYDVTGIDVDSKEQSKSSNLCHCEHAGMDGYMMKPPTRAKLRALLSQYLAARHSVGNQAVKGGLMTTAVGEGHAESEVVELFDEALSNFYAKENWFAKLFMLPFYLTRKFMTLYWATLACYGLVFRANKREADMIVF
mmetsp:Transcript_30538/g.58810  ORF Transcript_30538/g.58810 Transcript_30538/m.58810 type:complete len:355 (-) Transcript_30538:379-1443(-)|eukprot:CAMPEP_0114237720 /NCGR_PEP_ID=MMETSP0058-20121206/7540_1 /TAXON_ID=36894 /ORGANISM="Pyramimonas parkeae, CCMP726" /LENGTH=354 /DNA_ID=CAMNT_0001349779 /DNA_START=224 /DNA_END=1288 /DNA_ORIENTATION=-